MIKAKLTKQPREWWLVDRNDKDRLVAVIYGRTDDECKVWAKRLERAYNAQNPGTDRKGGGRKSGRTQPTPRPSAATTSSRIGAAFEQWQNADLGGLRTPADIAFTEELQRILDGRS